jgi:serpin B
MIRRSDVGRRWAFAFWLVLGGARCGGGGAAGDHGPTGQDVRSNAARDTAPLVSADDAATLAADNGRFAVDLYQQLRATNSGNLVFSPASVSLALAMAYAGAATTTASQMAATLRFTLPPERLHPAFDALDLALTAAPAGNDPSAFRLAIANDTWGQQGFAFLPGYLDVLARDYGAGLRAVDFAGATEAARQAINNRVAQETEQQIPELLAAGALDPSTRLVLTDAVFFHGDWTTAFNAPSPDGAFHAPTGDVSVPMMSGPEGIELWSGTGFSAAALPYVGGTTSMIVVVPDAGTFAAFEAAFTADAAAAVLAPPASGHTRGGIVLPRFKFRTGVNLAGTLAAMGMTDAFSPGAADFSGIDGGRDLFISDVIHQATIAVDEQGTTAAAATAIVIRTNGVISSLLVDRPFLFFIRHDPTGAILFAGRVVDPSAG